MLRLHLASAPASEHGWVNALRDPALAPALACLHANPERDWTVPELAHQAAVSRSLLDQRFREVLGLSPIRYLTEWRMHLAVELLSSSDLGGRRRSAAGRIRLAGGVQPGLQAEDGGSAHRLA